MEHHAGLSDDKKVQILARCVSNANARVLKADHEIHQLKNQLKESKKNLVSIYDNVRYVGGISSLSADRAEIDILSKKTKIFMENSNKKVQINSKSKNGNN